MTTDTVNETTKSRLLSFVERLERLDEEIDEVKGQRKEVVAELKGEGFDAKAVNKIVKMRKEDPAKRQEEQAIVELYAAAVGIVI